MNSTTALIILVAAPVVWFAAQALLSALVRPCRLKLRDGLAYLTTHAELSTSERLFLDHLWRNAYSARAAVMLCIAYAEGLVMSSEAVAREAVGFSETHPNFWSDRRMADMMDWYFVSIFAANPLFGVLSLILRWAWHLKVVLLLSEDRRRVRALPPMEAAAKI